MKELTAGVALIAASLVANHFLMKRAKAQALKYHFEQKKKAAAESQK